MIANPCHFQEATLSSKGWITEPVVSEESSGKLRFIVDKFIP